MIAIDASPQGVGDESCFVIAHGCKRVSSVFALHLYPLFFFYPQFFKEQKLPFTSHVSYYNEGKIAIVSSLR